MSRLSFPVLRRFQSVSLCLIVLSACLIVPSYVTPVMAQSETCQEGQKHLETRRNIIQRINALGKKKVSPVAACNVFGTLVSNGDTLLKWANTNKEWCQIPDTVVEGLQNDHQRAVGLRGQACKAAQQQAAMERKAREQAKQGAAQGGLFGGGGLTGQFRMPQGAL